ncbi:MAG: NFACT family protein [Erysipelotrichales bacterium]|nr:NFACT family protein [Erysipelotrichales bacterium]
MALDGILLHTIAKELQEVVPAKINRIHEVSDTEILFQLRHNGENYQLLISAHSAYNRVSLTKRKYPTPETPSNFVMVLRKYLLSGLITNVTQTGLDRCLVFTVRSVNEMGDSVEYKMYAELMGKYANLILVSPENRILHALKLIPPYANTIRTIQIGAPFKLTEPIPRRTDPFDAESFDPERPLTDQFEGFSPLLAKEVLYRTSCGQSFKDIMKELDSSKSLYFYPEEKKASFHVIPFTHLNQDPLIYPLFEGLDSVYAEKEEKDRIRQQTGDLYKCVRKERKKTAAKIIHLEDALEEALNSGPWMEKGQLIYAHMDQITKGMTKISLPSFETGELVEIPLDPKLDAKGNAKKCFQKYNKGKNGQVYIRRQLDITKAEEEYFANLEFQLENATFTDAEEIKADLVQNGYMKPSKVTPRRKKKKEEDPHYRTFTTREGHTLLYGKNNLQNEAITWKKAKKTDYWFHVKDAPGSHVVLMNPNPSEYEIRLAATLAAYHSSQKDSSSIPVNWCPIKNLKKIPGGKPGLVELSSYRTIYIDIVPELLKDDPEGPFTK